MCTHTEALAAVKVLFEYFERQDTPSSHVRSLERLDITIRSQKLQSLQQPQLEQFIDDYISSAFSLHNIPHGYDILSWQLLNRLGEV